MAYIEELRALIGNRPIVMVGATILVLDKHDRLLLLRRSDNHYWGVPGGVLEPGVSLEDTAKRETFEETGLRIDNLSLYGVFSGPELHYKYPNGDEVYNVSVVYITRAPSGELRVNRAEHWEWKFFEIQELPEQLSPPIKPIIESFVHSSKCKVKANECQNRELHHGFVEASQVG